MGRALRPTNRRRSLCDRQIVAGIYGDAAHEAGVAALIREYADALPDYRDDAVLCAAVKEAAAGEAPGQQRPIALLFYNDHDLDPFVRFCDTVVCDGDTQPMSAALLSQCPAADTAAAMAPSKRRRRRQAAAGAAAPAAKPPSMRRVFGKHSEAMLRTLRKSNPTRVLPALAYSDALLLIRVRIHGREYVVGQTLSRSDYRWAAAYLCSDAAGESAPPEWHCSHAAVVGMLFTRTYGAEHDADNDTIAVGEENFPESHRDLLLQMCQTAVPSPAFYAALPWY